MPGKKKVVSFNASDSVERKGRYVSRRRTDKKNFGFDMESIKTQLEKIRSKKCGQLKTQHALDMYWTRVKRDFEKMFRENLEHYKKAHHFSDVNLYRLVVKGRLFIEKQLGYVERTIATCAVLHDLVNPVVYDPFEEDESDFVDIMF